MKNSWKNATEVCYKQALGQKHKSKTAFMEMKRKTLKIIEGLQACIDSFEYVSVLKTLF